MSERDHEDLLEFPWPAPAAGAAPQEIVPGLRWARQSLASRLNHVNQWILEEPDGIAVVDTGVDRPDARQWWAETIARLGTLRHVLVTHHHYDHLGLAGHLCATHDAPLWMTRTEWMTGLIRSRNWDEAQRRLRRQHFIGDGLSPAQTDEIERHLDAFSTRLSPMPGAYRRLIAGERIQRGGRLWTILIGEGHAPEQALLYCAEDKLLIAADQVLPSITPHVGVWADEPDGNPLRLFLDTIDRLAELPDDLLVLPSHGLPFRGLHACLAGLRGHHERRLDQAEAACAEWRTAAEVTLLIFKPPRDLQDLVLAFAEALAHLHCLLGDGRVTRERGVDGLRRFRRAR